MYIKERSSLRLGLCTQAGTERESESYLSECLHFKESALRSLRKQFLGGRFISQRAKKELKIARFLR